MRVLDLFSGCGGFSLGFKTAGFEIVKHIDNDKSSYESAVVNIVPQSYSDGCIDINNYQFNENDTCDVIIGGPPCQAYSIAGRGKIASVQGYSDAHLFDNRGNLYLEFLRIVNDAKPKAILMENVPEIMSYGGYDIPDDICFMLGKIGYECRFTLLNAAEYGVPQYRERFFLMAIKNEIGEPKFPTPTHYIPNDKKAGRTRIKNYIKKSGSNYALVAPESDYPENLPKNITTFEALDDLPVISTQTNNNWQFSNVTRLKYKMEPHSAYSKLMRNWPGFPRSEYSTANAARNTPRDFPIFAKMKEGDKYPQAHKIALDLYNQKIKSFALTSVKELSDDIKKKIKRDTVPPYSTEKFPDKWRKLHRHYPSHTIVAHLSVDTYSHIHYNSNLARAITVREAARLQSFPDSFRFPSTLSDAYKQIGNAVPPLMAFHLATSLKEIISS